VQQQRKRAVAASLAEQVMDIAERANVVSASTSKRAQH